MSDIFVYTYSAEAEHEQYLYVNLTNRCTNRCTFCLRTNKDGVGGGTHLWLSHEPSADEIIEALKQYDINEYKEIVFCGYGEPTIRIDELVEVAKWIKKNYKITTRINTNGHGNKFHNKDITPLFDDIIDAVSISLNASNKKAYDECCRSIYGEDAFDIMLDFAQKATMHSNVTLSVVDIIGETEVVKCQQIADKIGAQLRVREYIEG